MNARARISEVRGGAVAAVFLVLAIVVSQLVGRAPQIDLREPLGFSLAPAGDDVPRLSPISVTFANPPVDRTPSDLLKLEPAAPGSYAWLSARTLLFQPDFPGLLRGSTYTVRVPARPEAGLPAPVTKTFTVTGKLLVQQVIPGDGDTEVPLNAQVLVQFSRSVAPLTTLAAQRADPVLAFDPPLHGKGEWLNTSIYRFVPTDLVPASTYRLKVAKGLSSAADGVLGDDFRSTFSTITPAVAAITPDDNTEFASPFQQISITFNQPMDPSAADGVSVHAADGSALRGQLTWNADHSVVAFDSASKLGVRARYVVMVQKGLRGAHGGATAAARTSTFTTVGLPTVSGTGPANGATDAGRFGFFFTFSNPMDPDSLDGKVSVSGFAAADLEGRVFVSERNLSVNLSLKPSTEYAVSLAAGATDRYGQVMGAYRFSFKTGALPSSVGLALPGFSPAVTYSSTAEPILYFQTTNQPSVGFTLWPLGADEGRTLLHDFFRTTRDFTPKAPALRRWTATVDGPKDEVLIGSTSLSGGGPLPKGYYFVRSDGQFASQFALAVVDTVIVTKLSNDELLAWALDHDTGKPLAGVTVRASGPVTPSEVTTDANGLASFKVPAPRLGLNIDRSSFLWIDGGGRSAVMSTRWQQGTSPFQFGLPGEFYAREWVGHTYTDRPIYRPGETVQYKGIVRTDDDAQYGLPPSSPPLVFTINGPRGQQLFKEDVKTNEFGSFAGSFTLPGDAPLGDYGLSIGQNVPCPTCPGGTSTFNIAGNSFVIAEFRKPEFQVEVHAGRASYVDGDTIDVTTTASFFFGGALAGAPLQWAALADPFALRVKGYERYSFSDIDSARQAVQRNALRASGRATTGADGVASYSIPAVLSAVEGAQRFTLSATVTDSNGQAVGASTTVTVHPASLYAGIRPAQYVANSGSDAKLDLVTVDTDGNVVAGRAVAVKVYDRQWITTKEQVPGGGRVYRSEPRDTLLATLSATTNAKGEASVTFRPTKPGSLRIVAEATDARGRTSRSATFLWVSGSDFALWQVTNDDAIKLVADKDRYDVGDTAEILVPAPFAGATALVTVERGKVITRSVQQFATNSERLRIPVTDHSVPDVFVSVVLYRPPTAADPIPRYKVGYVELPVSTETRVLNVSITPDREQARPGDRVRYGIKVTDTSGKGVRSEVSVAVVDKAILSLAEERGPDGLRAFWFERGLSVNTGSSMAVSVDRWNDAIAEQVRLGGKGGSGSGSPGDRQRQDFRSTAYWSAQLVTRDDGTAEVEVTMPDDLTTWRMQVRAMSGSTMVGEGTNELVSTKPLLLRPALPRFLRVGDNADLAVLVRNATKADADVQVTIKAEGVVLSGTLTRQAKVPAGASVALSWPAKVEAEGTVKVAFSGKGPGDLEDSVALSLPALLDVTPETMATGGVVAREGVLEAIYLPKFADTKHGSLSVSVRSALVGSMADELRFLEPYPHEGAEWVASRLIATIGVRRAEASAGNATHERDARIVSDLAGLVGRQRPDGGWAWCDDPYCTTDPNVTGWTLLALGEAKRDGLAFDAGVLQRAIGYVSSYVNRTTDVLSPADASQKAFLIAGLASAGAVSASATPARALFEQSRTRLASWGGAYLALALTDLAAGKDDLQLRTVLDDLAAATIPSANGNHWEDPASAKGAFMTSAATTSLVALALVRAQPDHVLLAQSVRWLVLARAAQGWQTSIDRALGVLALTTYAAKTGELGGDYAYRVTLDDAEVLAGLVKPGAAPTAAARSLPLTTLTPGKTSLLAFTRDFARPGRLYYTLDLRYVTPAKQIDALNRGFAISRAYTSLDDPAKPVTSARLGETVRVTVTVIAPFDHSYVNVEDPLPAGLEAVDARLKTTDPALKARLEADRASAAQKQSGGYVAPWFRWYYSPWQQVELRDDRAVLSAQRLSKGVYEYVYYARATTVGTFFVAPAHAEETYFPEVFGRSDSGRFTVQP